MDAWDAILWRIMFLFWLKGEAEKLISKSISFEIDPNGRKKLEVGQSIIFSESAEVGVSFGIYKGKYVPSIGSYSFSHSSFSESISYDIGNFVSIAEEVSSFGFEHPIDNLGTSPVFYQENRNLFNKVYINKSKNPINDSGIIINNDVWIGRRVLIKRGIKIGNGAVIGAGAVVTKNVPDYAVVGGNPAKILKYRFNEKIIERLLLIKWWNLPLEELSKVFNSSGNSKSKPSNKFFKRILLLSSFLPGLKLKNR